jgi:hypothetical protein
MQFRANLGVLVVLAWKPIIDWSTKHPSEDWSGSFSEMHPCGWFPS